MLHGEVIGLRDVITFQATSVGGLKEAFWDSVDDYLAWCAELGQEPTSEFAVGGASGVYPHARRPDAQRFSLGSSASRRPSPR